MHMLFVKDSKILLGAIAFSLFAFTVGHASESLTYLDGSKPFIAIENVNRQAEAWAVCAATYEMISTMLESQPARSKQMKEFSRGAKIAVAMTHVMDGMEPNMSPDRFNALWAYAKLAAQEWPITQRTFILADAEAMGAEEMERFGKKVLATVEICISNLDAQQMYIDSWRGFAKSGLLKLP